MSKAYLDIQKESLEKPSVQRWRNKVLANVFPQFSAFTGYRVKGRKILFAACGMGLEVEAFSGKGAKITGVDIDKKSVEYCKKNFSGAFAVADVEKMPFKNDAFDLSVSCYTLEHVSSWRRALREVVRCGECAYIKVPNGFYPESHKPEENAKKINPFAFVSECRKYGRVKTSWGPLFFLKPSVTVFVRK